jgi:hypothetical protein
MGNKIQKWKQTSTTCRSILIHPPKIEEERTPKPEIEDEQPVWDEVETPREELEERPSSNRRPNGKISSANTADGEDKKTAAELGFRTKGKWWISRRKREEEHGTGERNCGSSSYLERRRHCGEDGAVSDGPSVSGEWGERRRRQAQ